MLLPRRYSSAPRESFPGVCEGFAGSLPPLSVCARQELRTITNAVAASSVVEAITGRRRDAVPAVGLFADHGLLLLELLSRPPRSSDSGPGHSSPRATGGRAGTARRPAGITVASVSHGRSRGAICRSRSADPFAPPINSNQLSGRGARSPHRRRRHELSRRLPHIRPLRRPYTRTRIFPLTRTCRPTMIPRRAHNASPRHFIPAQPPHVRPTHWAVVATSSACMGYKASRHRVVEHAGG